MIYDPTNVKVAMDDHGILYHVSVWRKDADGNSIPEWVRMEEINFRGEFRRPEW